MNEAIAQARFAAQLAMLQASRRGPDVDGSVLAGVEQLAGITTGPGNQGSANTAHMMGQAATGGSFLSLPRTIAGPGMGGGTPV